MEFLTPDHPDAFIDFPPITFVQYLGNKRIEQPTLPTGKSVCAKCKGHGGWNLELNAYPKTKKDEQRIREQLKEQPFVNMPGHDMTDQEFRHSYVHFKASCDNCNGWGYVDAKQGDHVHEWDRGTKVGNCLTNYKCLSCGVVWQVDSSD